MIFLSWPQNLYKWRNPAHWHIGTRRTARSTFEPSWSLRMANPGKGSRDGRCSISNFQRWRTTRFPKSQGRCSSTFRATKTKSLKYIKTILHLEYLLQYYCVLEARDGYIKLFKGLLGLCREWGTGMIIHVHTYGWGHSPISCVWHWMGWFNPGFPALQIAASPGVHQQFSWVGPVGWPRWHVSAPWLAKTQNHFILSSWYSTHPTWF